MIGFLYLIILNFIIICITFYIINSKHRHFILYIKLTVFNLFLLYNAKTWNEGSMSGFSYIIPLLKPATDALNSLILFSIFSAFIPLIFYIVFIASMIYFCKIVKEG